MAVGFETTRAWIEGIRGILLETGISPVAIYLSGSRASLSSRLDSDVDLVVVTSGTPDLDYEELKKLQLRIAVITGLAVDIKMLPEVEAERGIPPYLRPSWCLWGKDLLQNAPLITGVPMARRFQRMAIRYMGLMRNEWKILRTPIEYPCAGDEFYGYALYGYRNSDGGYRPGFHHLRNEAFLIGSTRLAFECGIFPKGKQHVLRLATRLADRNFVRWLTDIDRYCDGDCLFGIPAAIEFRGKLRDLCGQTLYWERLISTGN